MMMVAETATGAPPGFPVNPRETKGKPSSSPPGPCPLHDRVACFFHPPGLSALHMRPTPDSLHNAAAARLRAQIFAGALAPGRFLPAAAPCARLATWRPPARDRRRGAFVGRERGGLVGRGVPGEMARRGAGAQRDPKRRVGGADVAA